MTDKIYDDTTIADNVADFVSAYNEVVSTIGSLTRSTGDGYRYLTGRKHPKISAASIRNTITAQVTGLSGSLDKLNDVGILIRMTERSN